MSRFAMSVRVYALVMGALLVSSVKAGPVMDYTLTDLGTLPGDSLSTALAINNNGQIVGFSQVLGNSTISHGFLYSGGVMQNIGSIGGTYNVATGINDSGLVVGYSTNEMGSSGNAFTFLNGTLTNVGGAGVDGTKGVNNSGQFVGTINGQAFVYSGGMFQTIPTPVASGSAKGINAAGQVVGSYVAMPAITDAFLYSSGTVQTLPLPASHTSGASGAEAVNDQGQIVGEFFNSSTIAMDSFLYSNGTAQDLGTGMISATGINNSEQIIGIAAQGYGVIYEDGSTFDLNDLLVNGSGYFVEGPSAINDNGDIVGAALTPSGQTHAILLTPFAAVPLPAAAWAALAAIPLVLLVQGRLYKRATWRKILG